MSTPGQLSNDDRAAVISAMVQHGGDFVRALGQLWARADPVNSLRIETTFHEYVEKYRAVAQRQA